MTRRALRETIFNILFRVEFNDLDEMDEQMKYVLDETLEASEKDVKYITDKVHAILPMINQLDSIIMQYSGSWKVERIGKVELAILRLAIYEMKYDDAVPYKVAINEAVELTKIYSTEEAKKYINGILGEISREQENA